MLTTDRPYCPLLKVEIFNITEDGKEKEDAIRINDYCYNGELCTFLDINSTIPVKTVNFNVRTYISKD